MIPVKANASLCSFRCQAIAAVVAAGQALRPVYDWHCVGHVDAGDQLAVDVELTAGRHPFPFREIGFSGRLELVAELDLALRNRLVGLESELVAAEVVVEEVESPVLIKLSGSRLQGRS